MNYEEKFIRLIRKFDCATAQLKHRGRVPTYDTNRWGLTVSSNKTYTLTQNDPRTIPFALILEGTKISEKIFSKRNYKEYECYCTGYYPYLELQRIFDLQGILQTAFHEGFQNNSGYSNYYLEDCPSQPELGIAFDVGRYLINKHFGIRLKHRSLPLFGKT